MTSFLRRGLIAGAAGTTVLNAITYADMAVRGRDAADSPERTVEALADALDVEIPGSSRERDNRVTALGALFGTTAGLAVGVLSAGVRALGVRVPAALDAALVGGAAMAATDSSLALLGVSDPRTWSARDWTTDALPHLGYGVATVASLRALEARPTVRRRAGIGVVTRSALLGVASGSRSSVGVAVPTLFSPTAGLPARAASLLALGGEFTADKSPAAPPRTQPSGVAPRFASAVTGATTLARREQVDVAVPIVAGAVGAAVGSWGGLALRTWGAGRFGDRRAALVEDGVALALAVLASRGSRPAGGTTARL